MVSDCACHILMVYCRFVGGKLNVCYNAVDRHVESGRGDQPAIIYDSPVTNTKLTLTYKQFQQEVSPLVLSLPPFEDELKLFIHCSYY